MFRSTLVLLNGETKEKRTDANWITPEDRIGAICLHRKAHLCSTSMHVGEAWMRLTGILEMIIMLNGKNLSVEIHKRKLLINDVADGKKSKFTKVKLRQYAQLR